MKIVDIAENAELNLALRRGLGLHGYMVSDHGSIHLYRNFFFHILPYPDTEQIVITNGNLREFDATVRLIRNAIHRWE
jgi:hypothetical protein